MANGGYLAITRINTFDYLNAKKKIELKDIDNLLYEDVPGKIIEKKVLTNPYPGIGIINKTKKGDFQKYHIYKTPLEIVIIKLGGKKEYAINHADEIFNSIVFKTKATTLVDFTPNFGKYSVKLPANYIAEGFGVAGKNTIQAYDDNGFYFLEEVPIHEVTFIEEDKFEAVYIHKAFYDDLKLEKEKGKLMKSNYSTYQSLAILDTLTDKKVMLRSIVKDEIYYLMGYVGKDTVAATSYFDSFKFKNILYKKEFKQVKDTALHFSVLTNVKQPFPTNLYRSGVAKKPYEHLTKHTRYNSKTNESIFVTRNKYHDFKMVENIDSLWSQIDKKYDYQFALSHKEKSKKDDVYTYSFFLKDSLSSKQIRVKNVLKKGVLFELRTLEDSISTTSKFVENFYNTFTPLDTLLGRDVFENKVTDYFKALKSKDSIADNAEYLIKYEEADVDTMIALLNNFEFPKDKKSAKEALIYEFSDLKSEKTASFLKRMYQKSYSDPKTQINILETLIAKRDIESYKLILSLLEEDFPIGSYSMNNIFLLSKEKDSLQLKRKLFPELLKYSSIQEYKQPVYGLLAQLKDSSIIKPRVYKKFKDQIFNDAKIELKRSLMKDHQSYGNNTLLSNYVNLLYPFREDKNIARFYIKLLESNNIEALSDYYVLLKTKGETIPKKLENKTLNDIENLSVLIHKLKKKNLLPQVFKTEKFQLKYAQSELFSSVYGDYDEDKISFLKKEELILNNKSLDVYFFKVKDNDGYSNSKAEWLYYIAFKKDKKIISVEPYFTFDTKNSSLKGTKSEDELIKEALDKIRYKDRKRLQGASNNYNY